jgi:hypothetical protein
MTAEINSIQVDAQAGTGARDDRLVKRNRARAVWAPIVVLETYLAITVLLFYFGPVDWAVPSWTKLFAFLAVNYAGLWLGFRWGTGKGRRALRGPSAGDVGAIKFSRLVSRLILFSMVFTIAFALIRLYVIRGGIAEVFAAFADPGAAYREAQISAQMDRDGIKVAAASSSWMFRFTTLFAVFNGMYFPLALACWRDLSGRVRVMFVATLAFSVAYTVGIGAQSGIGQLFFAALPVGLFILYVRGKRIATSQMNVPVIVRRKPGGSLKPALLVGGMAAALITAVATFQVSRANDIGQELDVAQILVGQFGHPSDRSIIPTGGGAVGYGIAAVVQYASHGYEGLALAMEQPFVPTYGLGWSRGVQSMYKDYLGGRDLFDRTYLARNEAASGWPALVWWSTIFPWIASDTSFYGTVFFMILVGFLLGRMWMAAVITGNPVAFVVLGQLFTLVFMFPANNALAHSLDGVFVMSGLTLIYLASVRYYRRMRVNGLAAQA